ncbi:ACP dehydratase [Desulfopila sp. IMCC35008]|uniref:ACP dehydratase n=1 Tax=Desulfopila sp. IMCC35008 TaxID=2653858 RepID=UPI0013D8816A|nr:ACP dehydratase [Desulfopila sp. IMCC35008]
MSMKDHCQLPHEALSLVPHRPPMLFVGELLERSGNIAVGSATMPESGICTDVEYDFPEYFVEVVAQTVAMANGYDAKKNGQEMNDGLFVGIDSFRLFGTVAPGARLRVVTEKTFEFGAVKIIHGDLFCEEQLVAQGDIKVWEDLGE